MRDRKLGEVSSSNKPELTGTDEPVFVLRAQDSCAIETLLEYMEIAEDAECEQSHLDGVDEVIEDFRDWQSKNPSSVKLPD